MLTFQLVANSWDSFKITETQSCCFNPQSRGVKSRSVNLFAFAFALICFRISFALCLFLPLSLQFADLSHFHNLTWAKTHITDLLHRVNLFLTSVFWNSPAEFFIKHALLCSHFDVKCCHCFQFTAPRFPSRHTIFLFVLFLTKEAYFFRAH